MPLNRHLLIVPHKEEKKTQSGVLLPEDFQKELGSFITATIVNVSRDCSKHLREVVQERFPASTKVIIDHTMVQEVPHAGKSFYLILENYVVGILDDV